MWTENLFSVRGVDRFFAWSLTRSFEVSFYSVLGVDLHPFHMTTKQALALSPRDSAAWMETHSNVACH